MVKLQQLLLAAIATQVCVTAAPSDVAQLEDIAKVETADPEATPTPVGESNLEDANTTGQRQKRWYDFGSFGFPPPISPPYPNYVKRDESLNTGVYGLVEDPLTHVYRRLQDIASIARQPSFPPALPPSFPIYLPVIYLPQPCNCNTQNGNKNGSQPDINNRFPEMEDTRQNWGYVLDDDDENDNGQDNRRPINFGIIPPNSTVTRKPPPVEHGTVQGDGTVNSIPDAGRPSSPRPPTTRRPPSNVPKQSTDELPTNCDAAVLSCCHRPEITFECFTTQGCPDVANYGNPCEPNAILRVIGRFQKFYQQRTG